MDIIIDQMSTPCAMGSNIIAINTLASITCSRIIIENR